MADVAIFFAYSYLVIALLAVMYRSYGIVARVLTRRAANNALDKIQKRFPEHGNLTRMQIVVESIFSDKKVLEDEFDEFAEVALASYIADKNRTIKILKNSVEEKDLHINVLGYILQNTMKEKAYLESVVKKLDLDSRKDGVSGASISFFVKHRIEGYAIELANIVAAEFASQPKPFSQYVSDDFKRKIEK